MHTRAPIPAMILSVALAAGCSSDGSNSNAAMNGVGGTLAAGGAKPTGGTPSSAGMATTGGSVGAGAASATGGKASGAVSGTSTGGTSAEGGSATGGSKSMAGSGGATPSGGANAGGTSGGAGGTNGGASAGGSGGSAPATVCTRDTLEAAAKTLQAALEAGDPMKMSLASGATYTENMEASMFGQGIWKSAVVVAFRRSLLDVESCESFSEIIVTQGHKYVIGAAMKLSDGKVSAVDNLVTDEGDWLFDADAYFKYSKAEDWSVIPEADRDTRETLIAVGNAYFDLFSDKTVMVPWNDPCTRLEGGQAYTGTTCNVGVPDGITFANKHWIVDRDLGTAVGVVRFGGANGLPDSHMFRSLKGKLRYVHTLTICDEPNCGL